ncbi:hypothetical protein L0668_10945 [Paraglaciecola aquimarina]|uniref:Uncharacterized protein n=1 Tax=Paraglaciecola algarum TaxID=3050085 RepID=A0ABS9DA13_9ALTE|nr:hypothetical protein [Paraglaciecola sp. G1-23]MCF2948624.1 hypothetical protein [Paraglaciecola sp. G1-23]
MFFNYKWEDHQKQPQSLNFSLPLEQINKKHHKRFVPDLADQYVYIELHKAARTINPKEASVKIRRKAKDIEIQVTSRSQNLLDKWQRSMQQSRENAFNQYLKDNYLSHFRTHLGQKVIKPDHLRYIAESKTPLMPIAQALYQKVPESSETRVYVNLLLSWVQSIPYSALEDRVTSNGAGYLPPPLVVASNQGDCDSKSALMASLIRSLLPDAKMIMLYLPNHALLGVSLPFRTTERTLNIEGIDYLLMEPTGPANTKLGEIALSSNNAINGNMHSYEVVP